MTPIMEALEKYFRCVKISSPLDRVKEVGGRHLAVKCFKFGTKISLNYYLYTFFEKIRDKKKYVSTFSLYINDEQNNTNQFYAHIQ